MDKIYIVLVVGCRMSEREMHHYKIELEKASSAEALIMAVQSEKDDVAKAKVYAILHYFVL